MPAVPLSKVNVTQRKHFEILLTRNDSKLLGHVIAIIQASIATFSCVAYESIVFDSRTLYVESVPPRRLEAPDTMSDSARDPVCSILAS